MNEENEIVPLDDAAIEALADIEIQERIAIASVIAARTATLNLFARQQKLPGEWKLAPNKRELIKVKTQQIKEQTS